MIPPEYQLPRSVWDLFANWAQTQPDHTAVICGSRSVSYRELYDGATRIADLLLARSVQRGDAIPVLARRTPEMVACFLAVLKAGACYVPIDTESWSDDRIRWTLSEVKPDFVLDADGSGKYSGDGTEFDLISHQQIEAAFRDPAPSKANGAAPVMERTVPVQPTDLAYIIFTSGTTSAPKGVMIPHRGLLNYVQQGNEETPFNGNPTPEDTLLLIFSPGFDACTGVLFSAICNGAQLLIATPSDFLQCATKCTILPATPSVLRSVSDPDTCARIRTIIMGGEAPTQALVQAWARPGREIYNGYGPTETTCASLMARLTPNSPITLGNPMRNSRIVLLDDNMAASDYGEICISGPGLARGYFRNEELTAAKFIIFEGERFYRTGDFARRTEHGLEFVGRVDSFVKNRGFLINLESQVIPLLSRCAGVQATTAFMYQDRLVAFVTPSTLDTGALRQSLASQNDSFLVPDRIRAVESLPLTPNGKIDNRALKLLLDTDSSDQDLVLNGGSKMDILRVAISIALSVSVEEICEEQSFWELGGNSLAAVKVLSLLRTRGFNLQLPALFGAGPLTAVCESIKASVAIAEGSMDTRPVTGPMTTMQIKMVRRSLQNPGLGYMLLRITLPHPGFAMNEQKLQEAWRSLMQRHSIFRTTFCLADEIIRVAPMVQWDWSSQEVNKDHADKLVQAHSSELRRLISQEVFGKEIAPMTAFRLVTVPNERSTLLVLAHHSQADGWSFSILLDELRALLDGRALPEAPDFIHMACEQRKLQESKHGSDFWDNVLQAHPDPPFLTLPPPTHNKPVPDWTPSCKLDLALTPDQLDKCARRLGVTQTAMLYTAWAVVLSYYTSSDQVAFGAVFSGRNISLHGADRVVGPLINTCPFFLDFESNETVAECTSRTFARLLQMIEYQWSADVAMAGMPTDYIKNVLQTVVVMEYDLPTVTESCEAFPDPWTVEREDLLEFDISLLLEIAGGSLQGRILYDDSHYDISTMQRMLVHFKNALSCLLAPETIFMQQVYDSILTFEERQWLLESPQPEPNLYPASAAVKDAFEVAASRWPNLPALESPFGSMTYSELDLAANAVAHSVAGVTKPGDVVVVLADGSLHWAISVIAIFKAGRICCVVDKNLPRNRVEAIIEQTGASAFVAANRACAEVIQYKKSPGWFLVICDELLQSGSVQTDRLPTVSKPRDTVYLVFTSGSTGIPKGVPLHNLSILNVIRHSFVRINSAPGRRNAQLLSLGFDVVLVELFGSLCYGATLVLKDPNDPFAHLKLVDATLATPSLLSACQPEDFPNLDTIALAGEPVPQGLADAWGSRHLLNLYGPAECGMISTGTRLLPRQKVTIGRPLPGMNAYLFNHRRCPVPTGVIGELYLSGEQVTPGYWNFKHNATFTHDPFSPGQIMYRTGDLAYWDSFKNLVYVRRVDNQIKVRGYRVELEEIERALGRADSHVRSAAAIVVDNVRIIAFVAPETVDVSALRRQLVILLPKYTRPTEIFALPSLPTSANFKIDRRVLLDLARTNKGQGELPSTATETLIAGIWKTLLQSHLGPTREIQRDDDFLGIGGNSLLSIEAARSISTALNHQIPISVLIRETVLSDLARKVDEYIAQAASEYSKTEDGTTGSFASYLKANPTLAEDVTTPSYLEEELFHLYSQTDTKSAFHVAVQFVATGLVNHEALCDAFTTIIRDDPILRARYSAEGGALRRTISEQVSPPNFYAGNAISSEQLEDLANKPFNLGSDQLLRVVIWQRETNTTVITIVAHHIITDKASIALMLQALTQNYQAALGRISATHNRSTGLPETRSNYITWAQWLCDTESTRGSTEATRKSEVFWKSYLRDITPLQTLSSQPSKTACHEGTHRSMLIPYHAGKPYSQRLAIAATALSLHIAFQTTDIVLAVPFVNRDDEATAKTLGLLVDRLPIRLNLNKYLESDSILHENEDTFVTDVSDQISGAVENYLPYRHIAKLLPDTNTDTDSLPAEPFFAAMVVYHWASDALENSIDLSNPTSTLSGNFTSGGDNNGSTEVTVRSCPIRPRGAMHPLTFEFTEQDDGLLCVLEFNPVLMPEEHVTVILEALPRVLSGLVEGLGPREILTAVAVGQSGAGLASA
ncbi:hypothetical protein BDW60DRAFT_223917 [Aspergillus nidulans var. acristatus]